MSPFDFFMYEFTVLLVPSGESSSTTRTSVPIFVGIIVLMASNIFSIDEDSLYVGSNMVRSTA